MPLADTRSGSNPAEPVNRFLERSDWQIPFRPLFRNGDLQTILGRYWPRSLDERRFPTVANLFRTEPDTQVLAKFNAPPDGGVSAHRPTVLAIHGLTACDRAPYMLSSAQIALESGFDAVRLNVRNCGGTEHLCNTLYHSGLTVDLRAVVEQLAPRPVYLLGFSMGGNIALKLAGEWGSAVPEHVRGVCSISAPIQLAMCSRHIGLRRNFIYERRFLLQLRDAVRRKNAATPGLFADPKVAEVSSIWEFDERVTAPAFGFEDAADYYRQSSAAGYLGKIRVPTLLIQARDDPFIPFGAYNLRTLRENPCLTLLSPDHGGHVAFLGRGRARFWAIQQAVRFFEECAGQSQAGRN